MKTEAVNILVKLLTNVVNHPGELKYRQVRLGNKIIEEKLLPASGAFEVLFSCGFEESDDKLAVLLGRMLRWHDWGMSCEADPKSVMEALEL